jgi:hypothetical protein
MVADCMSVCRRGWITELSNDDTGQMSARLITTTRSVLAPTTRQILSVFALNRIH